MNTINMASLLPVLSLVMMLAFVPRMVVAEDLFVSYSSHTDTACSSVPQQVAYMAKSSCTASDTCAVGELSDTKVNIKQDCTTDRAKRTSALFGSKPWILLDIYSSGTSCGSYISSIGYLGDGSCIVTDNTTSSIKATVHANRSASILTYEDGSCGGAPIRSNLIAAADLKRTTCLEGVLLVSTSDATVTETALTKKSGVAPPGPHFQGLVLVTLVVMASILLPW